MMMHIFILKVIYIKIDVYLDQLYKAKYAYEHVSNLAPLPLRSSFYTTDGSVYSGYAKSWICPYRVIKRPIRRRSVNHLAILREMEDLQVTRPSQVKDWI